MCWLNFYNVLAIMLPCLDDFRAGQPDCQLPALISLLWSFLSPLKPTLGTVGFVASAGELTALKNNLIQRLPEAG